MGQRNGDFETGAVSLILLNSQLASEEAHTFSDDRRTLAAPFEIRLRETAGEREPASIIVNRQAAGPVFGLEPHEDVARAAVAAHVDERLTQNLRHLAARPRRKRDAVELADKPRGNPGLALESLDELVKGGH